MTRTFSDGHPKVLPACNFLSQYYFYNIFLQKSCRFSLQTLTKFEAAKTGSGVGFLRLTAVWCRYGRGVLSILTAHVQLVLRMDVVDLGRNVDCMLLPVTAAIYQNGVEAVEKSVLRWTFEMAIGAISDQKLHGFLQRLRGWFGIAERCSELTIRKFQVSLSTKDSQEGDSYMKQTRMLVVSLRGVNFGFWSRLGCSGQSTNSLCHQGLVKGSAKKHNYAKRNRSQIFF